MPTIFPIVFAAISGTAMKRAALSWAQHGARLGNIEQLQGSVSLFSTLQFAFYLRSVKFSLPLLLLWSLSPIGGQAALRQLETGTSARESSNSTYYPDFIARAPSNTSQPHLSREGLYFAALNTAFPAMLSPLDVVGRLKIPQIEPSLDWKNINSTFNTTLEYVSYKGMPIYPWIEASNWSTVVETSYMTMNCTKFTQKNTATNYYTVGMNETKRVNSFRQVNVTILGMPF
jgi:hypothetical protein